jgi:hypothetical protein
MELAYVRLETDCVDGKRRAYPSGGLQVLHSSGSTNLGITTFNIMTLSLMNIIATLSINDSQHTDTWHKRCYAGCYYAECRSGHFANFLRLAFRSGCLMP